MDNILSQCGDSIKGWYCAIDRLRVNGILLTLQYPGSVVNWMKTVYPEEGRVLSRFPEFTGKMKYEVEKLRAAGTPYLEAKTISGPDTQAWLDSLYDQKPRAGSLVAIIRMVETVSSFSCRPRLHKRAKGHPKTGHRPVETAEHHLNRALHHIAVYYFHVYDKQWGRASIRIATYFPFEVTLQLNGHWYLERQFIQAGRKITMADNAVADVADWDALRKTALQDLEPAVRSFASHWINRLPHGLSPDQLRRLGGYYWYLHVTEVSLNYVFKSPELCRPLFDSLLLHNQRLGSPESVRYLFGLYHRRCHDRTSSQTTVSHAMGCFKAFYKSNWVKCYDKQGFILRFEVVINQARDFVTKKSLANLAYLTKIGQYVCRRTEQTCLTAVSCSVSAACYKGLVEPCHDPSSGRIYPAIRPDRPATQALLATLLSLSHCSSGFSNREYRAKHQEQHGALLNPSQATYQLHKFSAHGLIEPVGKHRRYQLTSVGRSMVAFLVKLYAHLLAPVVNAVGSGVRTFKTCIAQDPVSDALHNVLVALGIAPSIAQTS
jgi:hypothetical protein